MTHSWFVRPLSPITLYEIPLVAGALGVLLLGAAYVRHDLTGSLSIAGAWCIGLTIAWLSSCLVQTTWLRYGAGLAIGLAFFATGSAIAKTIPNAGPYMHLGTVIIGKVPSGEGVRFAARIEFENDSDDPAMAAMPSAWLWAKAEDELSVADAAKRVRIAASAAPFTKPEHAAAHQMHYFYILGPVMSPTEADAEIAHGGRFFVAGTVAMVGAHPEERQPFCAYAGATAFGVVNADPHDCPAP